MPALNFEGLYKGPQDLGSASLGTGWTNVGSAFAVGGAAHVVVYAGLTVNNSNNTRARLVGRITEAGSAYLMPRLIAAGTAAIATPTEQYYQFSDANQRHALHWYMDGGILFAQFQGQVGTAGATAAVMEAQAVTSIC